MQMLVIKDNSFVNDNTTIGMVNVVGILFDGKFEIANSTNVPNNQKVFIFNNYTKNIQTKFENNEMFFIDCEESKEYKEDNVNSSFYSSDGRTARDQKFQFSTILNIYEKFNVENEINIETTFRPTKYSSIVFNGIEGDENDNSEILLGPFQISSIYNEESNKWISSCKILRSSTFKNILKDEHVFKILLSDIPSENKYKIDDQVLLTQEIFEYLDTIQAEQIDIISNSDLISVMDQILTTEKDGNGPIGKKNRRVILEKINLSKKFSPQRFDRLSKLWETVDTTEPKIQDIIINKIASNKSVDTSEFEEKINDLEKRVSTYKKQNEADLITISDLRNANDKLASNPVDDKEKEGLIKKLETDLEVYKNKEQKTESVEILDYKIEERTNKLDKLKLEQDGLEKSIADLNSQFAVSNDKFREKALQVLPYIEMLNIASNKTEEKKEYFKKADQYEESFNKISDLTEIIHNRMKDQKFDITDFELNETIFYYLNSRFLSFYGKPGTGKTSYARALSNAITGGSSDENPNLNYTLFQGVENGWSSSEDLFGRSNLFQNKFDFTNSFFKKLHFGSQNKKDDFDMWLNIIFDEATLSPIEQYLAPFFGRENEFNQRDDFTLDISSFKFLIPKSLRFLFTMNFDFSTENISDRFIDRSPIILCDNSGEINDALILKNYLEKPLSYEKMMQVFDNQIEMFDQTKYNYLEDLYEEINPEDDNQVIQKLSIRKENLRKQYFKYMSSQDYDDNIIIDSFFVSSILPSIRGNGVDFQKDLESYLPKVQALPKTSKILNNIISKGENIQSFSFF